VSAIRAWLIYGLAVAMAVFHLYAGYFGQPEAQVFRSTHVAFAMMLTFLLFPAARGARGRPARWSEALDLGLVGAAIGLQVFILWDPQGLWVRTGQLTLADLALATLYLIILLEATRRAVGLAMLAVAAFFIANAVLGDWFPGIFYGPPHRWSVVANALFLGDDGVFGIPVAASASYIVLFIIFGQMLQKSRALDFFMNLALIVSGRQVGGPAKAAVVASAFEGTYTGSAVANVVGSGTFTIPLMKRLGYAPHFAGAVEAVASSGGQIMPPVMGVTAFVLAEIVGVPYWKVAMAAVIPAILYFLSIYFMVHFEARLLGLRPIPKEERPQLGRVLREGGHLLLPLVFVFYLLSEGFSVGYAATWGIAVVFALSFLSPRTRLTPRALVEALEESARGVVPVAIACASAGLIIGAIFLSGVGHRFSEAVLTLAQGQLWLALILTMLASFVLGMGLTTTADYIVLATFVIPALIKMGADTLGTHLFAFYFSSISGITPPVALASFAAAAIARAGLWETGFTAMRIGIAAFLIPYLFIYNPELLLQGSPGAIALATARAVLATACLAGGVQGWLFRRATPLERMALLAASVLFIWPDLRADLLGLALFAAVAILHLRRSRAPVPVRSAQRSAVGTLVDRWWPARGLARMAEAEVAEELGNLASEASGPRPTRQQALRGWAILAAVAAALTWTGFSHLQILRFNLFLVLTLALAFLVAACFPKPAPARALRPEPVAALNVPERSS
jgi:TRAP transporter 4TM/12TM fusion protein